MNNIPSVLEALYKSLQALLIWARRHAQLLINLATVLIAATMAAQLWFRSGSIDLVIFVGSPGSSAALLDAQLAKEIMTTHDTRGAYYQVTLESVPDGVSIRERMFGETRRTPLGIVDDGLQGRSDLRALVPLEWDYLYVICHRDLLRAAATNKRTKESDPIDEGEVTTLSDVIPTINEDASKYKVVMGPSTSTANRMATMALRKLKQVNDSQLFPGVSDWEAVRLGLLTGAIHLVFYSGPLGADFIKNVANDEECVLLGLGGMTDAIEYETGHQVYAAELPADVGLAKLHKSVNDDKNTEAPVAFCRENTRTIACRRVLACPVSLGATDAYLLAQAAISALINHEYDVNVTASDPPYPHKARPSTPIYLRMPPHPALQLLQNSKGPFIWRRLDTWPNWARTAVSTFCALLALDGLRLLTDRLGPKAMRQKASRKGQDGESKDHA